MFEKIRNFFETDIKSEVFKPRFENIHQVSDFLGDLQEPYKEIIKKWFFVTDKKEFLNDNFVFEKYKIIEKQFNIFIESIFVCNHCRVSDENHDIRIKNFIDDFTNTMISFEKVIFSSINSKILDTLNERKKIEFW